uniref:Uncharacterized protein n=1 Tax=Myotis myotis TaxID=51298 RepID=A0A7J7R2I1_MYOMY|nr:hypothetical protein mMyoMyo1_010931 [Myotis myotis]
MLSWLQTWETAGGLRSRPHPTHRAVRSQSDGCSRGSWPPKSQTLSSKAPGRQRCNAGLNDLSGGGPVENDDGKTHDQPENHACGRRAITAWPVRVSIINGSELVEHDPSGWSSLWAGFQPTGGGWGGGGRGSRMSNMAFVLRVPTQLQLREHSANTVARIRQVVTATARAGDGLSLTYVKRWSVSAPLAWLRGSASTYEPAGPGFDSRSEHMAGLWA